MLSRRLVVSPRVSQGHTAAIPGEHVLQRDNGEGVTIMEQKKWTVMVYLAGDNNLSEECVYALKELKRVGTKKIDGGKEVGKENESKSERLARRAREPRGVNVVAQFDPSGRGNKTRRFHVGDEDADGRIELDVVQVLPDETDTGARQCLLDFLLFGITNFPADYYMVVLAGHGTGTDQDFFLRDEGRPFSLIPSSLSIPDLKGIFQDAQLRNALGEKRIDILGFDACLMGMAEIGYELSDSCIDLMIGSEGFSPTAGWPYHRILRVLNDNPEIAPEQFARQIVRNFTRFYRNYELGGLSVDQSVLRVAQLRHLRDRVKALTDVLIETLTEHNDNKIGAPKGARGRGYGFPRPRFIDAIIMSHWEAQSYNGEQFVDLFDFCDILRQRYNVKDGLSERDQHWAKLVGAACEKVMCAIAGANHPRLSEATCEDMHPLDAVVLMTSYNGPTFQYSYGVSIYFPWSATEFANHYYHKDDALRMAGGQVSPHSHLEFPAHSGWGQFLQLYFEATVLRCPRKDRKELENVRSGPPASKGPNAPVHSMRNPPIHYLLSECVEDRETSEEKDGMLR
jgi:hypothetical protein